jgi:tRNA (guanine10-N2)-methyltransferase
MQELKKYDLKKRFYLGPTSLDHALAFIMANAARVKRGGFVLDPFVGTASILV